MADIPQGAIPIITSLIALAFAGILTKHVLSQDPGNEKMRSIADGVRVGASAFLKREYMAIVPVGVILAVAIALFVGSITAIGFVVGAILSALAGYIGMSVTVRTSSRAAEVAKKGLGPTLALAFKGGQVMGMTVAGLSLLAVAGFYLIFGREILANPSTVVGLGFGASLMAMFMRVSGGIYTKAADLGADIVGKMEAGIPEDDPRNPAVIADNVGDNVGDCAGMGADVYESFIVTAVAAIILGAVLARQQSSLNYVMFPLLIGAAGIVGSLLAGFYIRSSYSGDPMAALNQALLVAAVLTGVLDLGVSVYLFNDRNLGLALWGSTVLGLIVVIVIERTADYFTSYRYKPVRFIAESSQTSAATNFLAGYSVGLTSTAPSVLILVVAILSSYYLGFAVGGSGVGVYSTAIATMSMLSLTGIVISIDSFGPVTDNANGIVEMAGLDPKIREVTDKLDAVGNTTKATAKGFAIGTAALAALSLFQAFQQDAAGIIASAPWLTQRYASVVESGALKFSLTSPSVIIGLLIGGLIPLLFSSYLIRAVGKAASEMVNEVRRQFRERPGILAGEEKPDYARCVDISTVAALRELVKPGVLAIATPLVVGLVLGPIALGAMLIGSVVTGVFQAFLMANGGAAWDNAKKYIELGNYGGKKTPVHAAAVMGDMVGDPFKDTAGPSINALIKVLNTISIVFLPIILAHALLVF